LPAHHCNGPRAFLWKSAPLARFVGNSLGADFSYGRRFKDALWLSKIPCCRR